MKKSSCIAVVVTVVLGLSLSHAQFKSQVGQESRVADEFTSQSGSSSFFGWFNPEKFHMRHSVSFSYGTYGAQSMSLGSYTNSMSYEFANNLDARADVSMSFSPFNSFSTQGGKKNDLSSIYLSRAEVNYRPWENFLVRFQFQQLPYGGYYGSSFFDPWYRENGF